MKTTLTSLFALATASVLACGSYETVAFKQLALEAVSGDPEVASVARKALRSHGQAGLDAIFATHRLVLEKDAPEGGVTPQRVREALEAIGQQRDCHASRLFWHTDIEAAKRAAKAGAKPILSLRLLGNLDEEMSCANSRFFRTTLYANAEVSKFLRENFVLHWQSVRPAPRITIDFGDGRKMERTITGNSAHYVLDADGNALDALPGVYAPKAFVAGLTRATELCRKIEGLAQSAREAALREFHQQRLTALTTEWTQDLAAAGVTLENATQPVLEQLRMASTDAAWARMATLRPGGAILDAGSRTLIAQKNPNAWQAGRLAISKAVVEDPMLRLVRRLERSIAEDTVRNEYLLHSQFHQWFATGSYPRQMEALNAKVYAELFLTPNTDPWLGLAETDAYSALQNNGIVAAAPPVRR